MPKEQREPMAQGAGEAIGDGPEGNASGHQPSATDAPAFDVVLVQGATTDGQGARVLRARPGQLEAGEVRPVREGQPLAPGGEVVRLVERSDAPRVYDVKVDYKAPALPAGKRAAHGPPQVATEAYRESWERTFATPDRRLN